MSKQTIREQLLTARRSVPQFEVLQRSEAVHKRLHGLAEFNQASTVLCYVSCRGEVDTLPVLEQCIARGVSVFAPRIDGTTMEWRRFSGFNSLKRGRFGILEPTKDSPLYASHDDAVVLVPGVAFTPHGDRLGMGGGYFDQFLATSTCFRVGLAFDYQIVDSLPHEEHDQIMDVIVTESTIYPVDRHAAR